MKNCAKLLILAVGLLWWAPAQAQIAHTFNLSWTDNSDNEEGFYVYRGGARIGQVGANVAQYSDAVTGAAGQSFCYQVSAFNHQYTDGTGNIQESAMSNQACASIPTPTQLAPNAPSGLTTISMTSSSIRLSWADNASNETSQEIAIEQSAPPRNWTLPVMANVTSYNITGLRKNTRYTNKVRAVGDGGVSEWSNETSTRTLK